jgi:hypothetical protein
MVTSQYLRKSRSVQNDTRVYDTADAGRPSLNLREFIQESTQNIPLQRDVPESALPSNFDQPRIFQFFGVVRHCLVTDLMQVGKIATVDLAASLRNLLQD